MAEQNVFTKYVLPVFTVGIVNWMFAAPLKTLWEQNKVGTLGFLNPTPWVFMFGNCFAWVTYAMVIDKGIDYRVTMLLANGPGLVLSVYLNICACKLQYQDYMSGKMKEEFVKFLYEQMESGSMHVGGSIHTSLVKTQQFSHLIPLVGNLSVKDAIAPANHEKKVVIMSLFWLVVITCLVFIPMSPENRTYIVGIIGNFLLIFFYAAPLSTIMTVLKTRSSATIHVSTMVLNTVNSSFWFVYTLFQNDPWQYVPNGIGSTLGFLQIFLACAFPRKYMEDDDFSDQSELFDNEISYEGMIDSFMSKEIPMDINGHSEIVNSGFFTTDYENTNHRHHSSAKTLPSIDENRRMGQESNGHGNGQQKNKKKGKKKGHSRTQGSF